jgi:NhaP-type Na+/H+ or K+/H+ antiporter
MPPGALINIAKLMSGGVVLGVASGGVLVWILRPINSPA